MAESGLNHSLSSGMRRAGRAEKFVSLLVIFILLTAAAASVSTVLTGPNWQSLWGSLLFGLLLGWLLAIFRWPAWRSALLVTILGVIFCLLFAASLNEKIAPVFSEFFRLVYRFITTLQAKSLDYAPISAALTNLAADTAVVLGRVSAWLADLVSGQANYDPVAAGIVWSFTVWMVAAWAGWMIEATKNALAATLPALLLCLSTLSYVRNDSAMIYLLLGLTLVLVAVVQYDHLEQVWIEGKVAYPARKVREVGNMSLLITILLVLLAAIISSVSIRNIIRWSSKASESNSQGESGLAKSLGIIPAATPTADSFSDVRSPGLPRELLIGSGPELSGKQVMVVHVNDLGSLVIGGQLAPLYWRSFTYDDYTGHGWKTSATQLNQYQPGQPFQPGQLPQHVLVREEVILIPGTEGSIYAAGEPVSADVPSTGAWRSSNDLFGVLTPGNGYTVDALVPLVDASTLRQAGQEYPGWVVQRYLSLPADVPARVKELAIQLSATEPTPYDRAHAIEQYLRQTYPYSLDVPRPPANQDLVDYFLFDLRKGYCDYYASAMVVLSRAAGIPARLAIGYASGEYNLNSKRFSVTQADAHSWAEIYFPSIGWVPFEPTAGLPAINRSAQPIQPTPPAPTPPVTSPGGTVSISFGKYTGWIVLFVIGLIGFALILLDEVSLSRKNPQSLAMEVFNRLKRYAAALGVKMETGDTPFELGSRLCERIAEINGRSRISFAESNTSQQVQALIGEIVLLSYRPTASRPTSSSTIVSRWRTLRWRLRLAWVRKSWSGWAHGQDEKSNGMEEGKTVQA